MKFSNPLGLVTLILSFLLTSMIPTPAAPPYQPVKNPEWQGILDAAVAETLARFAEKGLQTNELAATMIDLRKPGQIAIASYRGDQQIYPASVIKMFYLVAAHQWMQEGKLQDTEELRRAMKDMIVESGNEPTHYIIDLLTGTTSGPELSPAEMEDWYHKRNAVNRYFASLGYQKVNANRKPWCEGPYGRESQSVKMHVPNHRNWLTTDETARLLTEIVQGWAVSPERSKQMLQLMERNPFTTEGDPEDQARGFTGMALQKGDKLWSKAGWTSQTRHDAAYLELSGGQKLITVVYTEKHANEREIIPSVVRGVLKRMDPSRARETQ